MPRVNRARGEIRQITIENHPYNKYILPEMRTEQKVIDSIRDIMPVREMMDSPIHGWTHILHMLVYASYFCQFASFDVSTVYWSILFHDSGRYSDSKEVKHPQMGAFIFSDSFYLDAHKARAKAITDIIKRHNLVDGALTTEEAIVRTCDRLDLWRMPGFGKIDTDLVEAPGWPQVEKVAKILRGNNPDEIDTLEIWTGRNKADTHNL